MSNIDDPKYRAALETILHRAGSDPAFRASALSDAPAAIKEATGLDVPEGVTVKFVEFGQAGSFQNSQLVIPLPPTNSDELTDSELLDEVAGGVVLNYNPGGRLMERQHGQVK